MNTDKPLRLLPRRWRFSAWAACIVALLAFAAGSFVTARLMRLQQVRADNSRVFELMVYHTVPGKVPELESIFRDVSKLQEKYSLHVLGYWVPQNEDPFWTNTFVYVVAHPNLDEAKKNWHALHADSEFPPYRKAAEPLIEKVNGGFHVDEVYMRPSDFSALR